jgi:SAM-dependent methyltransferase
MSKSDKDHWEKKYSGDGYEPSMHPSALLTEWLDDRPPGRALDLASGTGRNALYLAEKGYDVTAVEISPLAIQLAEQTAREKGLKINWIVADLDDYVIQGQYDLILVSFFYVSKHMVLSIIDALKKGGILLYENHMLSPSSAEDEAHKHRFHLKPGELRQLFKELNILRYEELPVAGEGDRPSYHARLLAQKE